MSLICYLRVPKYVILLQYLLFPYFNIHEYKFSTAAVHEHTKDISYAASLNIYPKYAILG